MDSELLPGGKHLSTEAAWFVLWFVRRVCMTLLNLLPCYILCAGSFESGLGLDLGLRELVLSDEMLEEVVATVTDVLAIFNIAGPPLKMLSQVSVQ